MSGTGMSGAGISGAGASGAGISGAGISGAGISGAGISAAGATGAGISEAGTSGAGEGDRAAEAEEEDCGRPAPGFLAVIAGTGLVVIGLYGAGLVSPAALVEVPTTLFLVVYLGCMASAVRVLRGPARLAAAPAAVIVAVVLAFCGSSLLGPVAVAAAVSTAPWLRRQLRRQRRRLSCPADARQDR
jgi:amino acid efflux transporter